MQTTLDDITTKLSSIRLPIAGLVPMTTWIIPIIWRALSFSKAARYAAATATIPT